VDSTHPDTQGLGAVESVELDVVLPRVVLEVERRIDHQPGCAEPNCWSATPSTQRIKYV